MPVSSELACTLAFLMHFNLPQVVSIKEIKAEEVSIALAGTPA